MELTYNDYLNNIKPDEKPAGLISALERIDRFEAMLSYMAKAVRENGGRVINLSDYDTDGIMSALILNEKYGIDETRIADKYEDGYGIPNDLSFLKEGDLVILSDIGSDSVDKLKEICVRTKTTPFIIDHHEMNEELKAYLKSDDFIKPMVLNFYDGTLDKDKIPDWCSSGLCYQVALAGGGLSDRQKELIAVYNMNGTIGDVVKVNNPYDTNREDILKGFRIIEEMDEGFEPKFGALLYKTGLTEKPHMTTEAVQFGLSPVTTLGKRMESMKGNLNITDADRCNVGQVIFDMLKPDRDWETKTPDLRTAFKNADALKELNDIRKKEVKKFEGKEYNDFLKKGNNDSIAIYVNEKIPAGYAGLVAMDISKELNRPAVVFTKDRVGNYVASGRNVKGYPDMLEKCTNEYALHIGGHTEAYGVTVKPENFQAYISTIKEAYKGIQVSIDTKVLKMEEIKEMTIPKLLALEPFGTDYPKIEAYNELVIGTKTGRDWNTVTNADNGDKTRYFGRGIIGEAGEMISLKGTLGVNFYANIESLQMNVSQSDRIRTKEDKDKEEKEEDEPDLER